MKNLLRHAPGLVTSIVMAAALASPSIADGIDPDRLVKFGERDYIVDYADWVSTDPISMHRVKKIEAGRVSEVAITRTSTGTYSTDALTSRHVQYPGITVRTAEPRTVSFAQWAGGQWTSFEVQRGNSFVSVSTYKTRDGKTRTTSCITTASFWYC
ncbi:hypothetical protein [Devosia sp. FJ2-5-3]|uniref:hypothetical protein n=1 Tax=Devosia sp. FJ2-5-3 TaxID=2976680 RepID=UPI0023D819D4|nr:hypothetical protein [Devosia sp. FJ2-5-3]WEJ57678.1 hypothetical protein N0P34_15960 [Devosia sp. FJ2-5-3]